MSANAFLPTSPMDAEGPGRIDTLAVSDKWKQRFYLIEEAGGPTLPGLKKLKPGERVKVRFNVLAFLFGPLYFIAKGMWKKAVVLFGMTVAVLWAIDTGLSSPA